MTTVALVIVILVGSLVGLLAVLFLGATFWAVPAFATLAIAAFALLTYINSLEE